MGKMIIQDDAVTLGEVIGYLIKKKWQILSVTILFVAIGVAYALSKPNIYQAQVILSPASSSGDLGGGASSQLGGLAALAGVNLGGASNDKSVLYLEIFQSRKFLTAFIDKHSLQKDLFAAEGYDLLNESITYDEDKVARLKSDSEHPITVNYIFEKFIDNNFIIEVNKKTGLITLSIRHFSPIFAKKVTELIVKDINYAIRTEEIADAIKSINYLEKALGQTNVLETKKMFYQLIEQQHRTKMLATVKEEYAFKVIDPAIVPERKFSPNRALIVVVSGLIGGIFICMVVIVSALRNKN
ncbi:lipopolysaccharide biosynthesis protein [Pseudoalteromonas shioyasakiensis]|uniref:Wzz/FepE/Etk N-terminal domain-containing protein n=1 Tax=Pseudoalteromonas shioyasakiensis TaxID=1190813 RepID=UPI002095D89E|nr:Wzz/FepE/Etk N-terminal domain-containing protein [Pseudoalteromonas shioyasakiensis]MCO6356659.1 lipopolysaccharide biosynthesis protein [Pseudoalteromonas shioyasakiensis]